MTDIMFKTKIGEIRDDVRKYIFTDSIFRNYIYKNAQSKTFGDFIKVEFIEDEYAILFYVDTNKNPIISQEMMNKVLNLLYQIIGMNMYKYFDQTILDARKNVYLNTCASVYRLYIECPEYRNSIFNSMIISNNIIKIII